MRSYHYNNQWELEVEKFKHYIILEHNREKGNLFESKYRLCYCEFILVIKIEK